MGSIQLTHHDTVYPALSDGASLKDQYKQMVADRDTYLDRAQRASLLTQPSLFPEDGHNGTTDLTDPFQSEGARGVENLTSKLLTGMFPAGLIWFKERLTAKGELALSGSSVEDRTKEEIQQILTNRANIIWKALEQPWFRPRMAEAFRHLIVGGNGLLQQVPGETRIRFWPMTSYGVRRDNGDNLLDVITEERVDRRMLNDEQRSLIDEKDANPMLYTGYHRVDRDTFRSYQEIGDKLVPGSEATYPADLLPVMPMRWESISGESWGRSFVDKVIGDLATLEGISEAVITIAAEACRLVRLVDPAGVTNIDDLETAQNGEYRYGREQDVHTLQSGKMADMQMVSALSQDARKALREAFFVGATVQRSGDRVTATEIQFLAGELDNALGGAFSQLSEDIQSWIVRITQSRLTKQGHLEVLPNDLVETKLVTGLEGLGRNAELQAYSRFDQLVQANVPPEEQSLLFNYHVRVMRMAEISGIDPEGYILTRDEYEERIQQRQQAQTAQAAVPIIQDQLKPQ